MFHFDLRNYQSASGRSVLHPPTLDVFVLLSVFQLLRTFGLAKCGNVVPGKEQREDGSCRLFLPPLLNFKIKKKRFEQKGKGCKIFINCTCTEPLISKTKEADITLNCDCHPETSEEELTHLSNENVIRALLTVQFIITLLCIMTTDERSMEINQVRFTQTTVFKCFHHITLSQVSKLSTRLPQWQQRESKDEHEDLCSDVSL